MELELDNLFEIEHLIKNKGLKNGNYLNMVHGIKI